MAKKLFISMLLLVTLIAGVFAVSTTVSTLSELQTALANDSYDTVIVSNAIALPDGTVLDGKNKTVQVPTPYLNADGSFNSSHNNYAVFTISSGSTVSISNMTIYGGHYYSYGGAITTTGGRLNLTNCTISRSARGLYIGSSGNAVVKNCNFVRNASIEYITNHDGESMGGAILVCESGILVIDGCSLTENRCHYAGGAIGTRANGAVYANNCVISNNYARGYGGGIGSINSSGKNYIMNCTITGNYAGNFDDIKDGGGGIFGQSNSGSVVVDYVVNSVIAYNYSATQVGDNSKDEGTGKSLQSSDLTFRLVGTDSCLAQFNNCLYGACSLWNDKTEVTSNTTKLSLSVIDSIVNSDSNPKFASFRNDGILYTAYQTGRSDYITNYCGTTTGFKHPILTAMADNKLSLYVPLKNLSTGGVVTYFDYSDLSNIKMSYGENNTALTDLDEVTDTANYKVSTYFEGGTRSATQIGASASVDDNYYTLKLGASPSNGTVSGITSYGDSYIENTQVTVEAFSNDDCEFVSWNDSSNNVVSTDEVYSFKLTSDLTLTANFKTGHTHKVAYSVDGSSIIGKINCHSGCSYSELDADDEGRKVSVKLATNLLNLTALHEPVDAGDDPILWTSSDTSVATVEQKTGKVRGVGSGTVTITAQDANAKGVKKTVNLTVLGTQN